MLQCRREALLRKPQRCRQQVQITGAFSQTGARFRLEKQRTYGGRRRTPRLSVARFNEQLAVAVRSTLVSKGTRFKSQPGHWLPRQSFIYVHQSLSDNLKQSLKIGHDRLITNRQTLQTKNSKSLFFQYVYCASFIILHNDQQMHTYFTNYHTATCFDTKVPSSGSL